MGEQWLSDVTNALRQAGWPVEAGYPGKKAAQLAEPAFCVNLSRADTRQGSAGITVTVLVPRSLGLAKCQLLASEAAVLLAGVGGDWSFSGWHYDSGSDCFRIEVEGDALLSSQEEVIPEGYQIFMGDEEVSYVTGFLAKKDAQRRLIRSHGQSVPAGVTPGMDGWVIELVQVIPAGTAEPGETEDGFILRVSRGGKNVVYSGCCWAEYESCQQTQGTQVTRRGYALSREVA